MIVKGGCGWLGALEHEAAVVLLRELVDELAAPVHGDESPHPPGK